MCGFSGCFFLKKNSSPKHFKPISLNHRGPDDFKSFKNNFLKINFFRLKILGGASGRQPMMSENKKFIMVFNGEIYNYIELAHKIKRPDLIKKGDTRVLLEYISVNGLKGIKDLNGMFSIVFFDLKKKKIFLIRDRFGIKPLYYRIKKNIIFFSSEIKSLPLEKDTKVKFDVLNEYLESELYPNKKKTFYKNIFEIEPGTINEFNNNKITSKKYYSLEKNLRKLEKNKITLDDFEKALERSIKFRLRSDVPISMHFSGGVDSTALLCKLREMFGRKIPVSLYFLKFKKKYDYDFIRAKKICKKLKQKLNVVYFNEKKFISSANDTQYFMDEPFGGIPTIGMCQLNKYQKKRFPVSLEGQGSDEILSGYFTHVIMAARDMIKNKKERKILLKIKKKFNFSNKTILDFSNKILKNNFGGSTDETISVASKARIKKEKTYLRTIEYFNLFLNKLPRVLRFHDRISAGYSRELRFPFLDHNVIEIAMSLSNNDKFKNGYPKYPLFKIISRHLPVKLFMEKKRSSSVPQFEILLRNKKWVMKNLKNLKELNKIKKKFFERVEKELKMKKISNSFHIWQMINISLFLKHFENLKKIYKV